ncbi:hypothetical protein RRG08_057732 [Elysia crispata]|uniref:Uncharacterized protein n=1 Tax=Elysia crispata TaxID=231223 RepID=A0AAE0Y9F8_9GAST|nr:hypothetical protein RRG08_057732 [Elysia crispata]
MTVRSDTHKSYTSLHAGIGKIADARPVYLKKRRTNPPRLDSSIEVTDSQTRSGDPLCSSLASDRARRLARGSQAV